ncbi:MAG: S9 family peptidase [Bacteroidetes bacterium]|nr:S9 family peptidase [Bacteroidota bacterium]
MKKNISATIFAASLVCFSFAQKQITLDDVWKNGTFRADYNSGYTSMHDGEHYMDYTEIGAKNEAAYVTCEYKTGKQTSVLFKMNELIPENETQPVQMDEMTLSPDETKVLISTATEHIYRYSTKVTNFIFDMKTKKMFPLSTGGKQRLAQFSPDSKKVAFVRDNNIFIVDLDTRKETQVTMDGEWNHVINGGTDWVYEEEFTLPNGMYWSPDSKKIAFYRFDETRVKEFQMTMYNTGLYPEPYSYKYPKAGEENSIVTIHIYNLDSKQTIPVDIGTETDQYIARVNWTQDANTLSFQRLNRLQNKLELFLANANDGTSKVILTEKRDTYVEVYDHLTFLKDKLHFIWSSDESGYLELYECTMDGKNKMQITKGDFDVIDFYGYDEKTKTLFYQSNEGNIVGRDIYSIKIDGKEKKKISTRSGNNSASFSSGMKYYVNFNSNANTPYYISINDASGKEVKMLVDNHELAQKAKDYGFAKKEFFTVKDRDGVELNGWMIKPVKMEEGKKYPVLQVVYGGPGHNTVVDQWESADFYWHQYLQQQGVIIVSVDNRGTEYRGVKFKKCTYGQMGKLESADQIDVAKYLGTLPYVDAKRIGIWGWSYGGYMASLCLGVGADYFKCAVAVAPVSSWRFYDSIYTERYMGLPQNNAHGYDDFSPVNNMDKVKGKLLLVHGTGDDNVHFQNSVALINALIDANKEFEFYMYPDRNHSIRGGNSRIHLYTKITDFLKTNL